MTTITTAAGTVPLILASGAGAETRQVIGVVVFSGVTVATLFTLFIVPLMYSFISGAGASPLANSRELDAQLVAHPDQELGDESSQTGTLASATP